MQWFLQISVDNMEALRMGNTTTAGIEMNLTMICYIFTALGAASLMSMFILLPMEETGVLGRLPSRINNFMLPFVTACLLIGMFAYWLK
jgi:hypothetical protein